MWHHRIVFSRPFVCLGIATSLLGAPTLATSQTSSKATSSRISHTGLATSKSAAPAKQQPAADLQRLIHTQADAVSSGDTAAIVDASRKLSAQILALLAQFRLANGRQAEAIDLYRQSLAQEPSTQSQLEFASALLHAGNAAAAITETDSIVAANPDNAAAWMTRGSALKDTGRSSEAVEALKRALQLRPDPHIAFTLGSTYLSLHDKTTADAIFHRLLEASNHSAIWYIAIGDAYRDAGYMEDAVTNLKAGLAREPKVLHGEFFLGLTYLQMNQWGPSSDSFLHLHKAVELSPREYISNFYLGALESTDGSDLAASDRHLHAAVEADPTQAEAWLYLGLNANREKRTAEAKTYLQKAIDLTGTDESRNNYQVRRAYFSLGRLLIAEGNKSEGEALLARYKRAEQAAVAESGKSITETEAPGTAESPLRAMAAASPPAEIPSAAAETTDNPDTQAQKAVESKLTKLLASTLNDQGTAEARQHDYAAALQAFQQSEKWDSSDPVVLRNLGIAAFRLEQSAEAARALHLYKEKQLATGLAVENNTQLMLALSEFNQGNFPEAAKDFSAVESVVMGDPRTAYSYAFALARTGKAQEANRIADALSAQALPADLTPLVCHIYIDTENYNGSQTCYHKALEQEPNLQLAHYEIGESLIHLDRPAEAIPELRQELTITPDNPNVMTALAFSLLQTSQKAEARSLLEATVKAHPEHAEAQYECGKLLLEEGDVAGSIPHLEASEAADATKDYVHYQLGNAYKKAGRTEESQRELRTYREIKDRNRDVNATPH